MREFDISNMRDRQSASEVDKALDSSEVIFHKVDYANYKVYICDCDECEQAARSVLKPIGYELSEPVNKK